MSDADIIKKEQARIRKQRSRARLSAVAGVNRIEVMLNDSELEALDSARTRRNPGRDPYPRNDYLALLILNDIRALEKQENAVDPCLKCGAKAPGHCERAFKGDAKCWLSYDCLALNLTCVTGHNSNATGCDHDKKQ